MAPYHGRVESAAPFVGRQLEMEALQDALTQLTRSRPGAVLLGGEPGIGKTRLLGEVAALAGARRHLVLTGRATELESDMPFGVVIDALDDHLASLERHVVASMAGALAGELTSIFPALAEAGAPGPGSQGERYKSHRAVRALLSGLAGSGPMVLLLDDVHWADPASVELLCHLLRRPPQGPALMVFAFRPAQAAPELLSTADQAVRDGLARRLDVGPLSRREAHELAGAHLDRRTADQLYHVSGGNPFYLEQLARTDHLGTPESPAVLTGLAAGGVPAPVRRALKAELTALSDAERTFLQGAAVVGDPFDADLAAAAAGVSEDVALESLDRVAEVDLVRPTGLPRRFRFRHPIIREAVYELAGPGWRLGAHRRAAVALASAKAPATAQAHHWDRSAKPGDDEAVRILIEAATAAEARAPDTAARWFSAALRLLPGDEAASEELHYRRLMMLVALARALGSAGRLEESHAALVRALGMLAGEPASLRVPVIAYTAAIEHLLGRHQDAHARLEGALEALPDRLSPEAAALQVELAVDAIYAFDFANMRSWAESARSLASALGDAGLVVGASALLGLAEYCLGAPAEAAEPLDAAAQALDAMTDAELAGRLDVAYYLGWAEHFMERDEAAVRHLERGLAVARAHGQGHVVPPMMLGLVLALAGRGRIVEADELAEAAVEAARLSGNVQSLSWALWLRCLTATLLGDLQLAIRAGEEGVELGRTLDHNVLTTTAGWMLAAALVEAGEAGRARDSLLEAQGGAHLPFAAPAVRCHCYELLVRAEVALGRVDAAAEWADRAEAIAPGPVLPLANGAVLRARATVLLASGEPGRAAELAALAACSAAEVGAPIDTARSRIVLGQALARHGRRSEAVEELARAEAVLADCAAAGLREQAVRHLKRLGRHVRSPADEAGSRGGPGGVLTPRELEIAHLVACGRTNREIAASVYLSEKTVESHLSHVFVKLGLSSRAALASWVARGNETATRANPT